jgi:hypothetical protein
MRVSEKRAMREIFGPKEDKLTGDERKLKTKTTK